MTRKFGIFLEIMYINDLGVFSGSKLNFNVNIDVMVKDFRMLSYKNRKYT